MKKTLFFLAVLVVAGNITLSGLDKEEIAQKIQHIPDYEPVPGDVYTLTLGLGGLINGGEVKTIQIPLQQDYTMEVPFLGTINARGRTFQDLRKAVLQGIKNRVSLQYVDFTLTVPAVFDLVVYGAVQTPGKTTAYSLMTLYEALGAAGGPREEASLRHVQLERKGTVTSYDLLAFLAFGDETQNPRLKPGDKIHVPVAEQGVKIQGAVLNPGSFELVEGDTLATMLSFAGGVLPTASPDVMVLRLDEGGQYRTLTTSLDEADRFVLQNGDIISISSRLEQAGSVVVEGAFFGTSAEKPEARAIPETPVRVSIPYHEGMSVLEVLKLVGGPTPYAAAEKARIIRKDGSSLVLPHLSALWETGDTGMDVPLKPGDYFVVPMKPLKVFVGGNVNSPGSFPFAAGYTVGEYLALAHGLDPKTGSPDALYFVSADGTATKVDLTTVVEEPGTVIYAGNNAWKYATDTMADVSVVVGFFNTLVNFGINVLNLIERF
ncbi:polysaccharide biosynthesis/export family protein [Spirochaeta thermophila]|uniref:Polysaccharide biosynthesis protein n=1 Tax=Winmispira thermophila (strain ATCC 49972 / DSM 6192 / RI 19.B1) TaxID=665571 RepID=E0RN56_WINT6|nr:SLBB domain-containing protein [Spirochaeta thermophila]ADN02525.1 polysaccharide biosynthesis protein [Spirochaeta thermophila DSM 6192]